MQTVERYTKSQAIAAGFPFPTFSPKLEEYVRTSKGVVSGSFVTHIVMRGFGMNPTWTVGDLDLFTCNQKYDDIPFRITGTIFTGGYDFYCASSYGNAMSKLIVNCAPELVDQTPIVPQIILMEWSGSTARNPRNTDTKEPELFDVIIGNSMDFVHVSSTIHFDERSRELMLTVRNKRDIVEMILRQNQAPVETICGRDRVETRPSRAAKWLGRGWVPPAGVRFLFGATAMLTCVTPYQHENSKTIYVTTDCTRFFMCTKCVVHVYTTGCTLEFFSCNVIHVHMHVTPASKSLVTLRSGASDIPMIFSESSRLVVTGHCVLVATDSEVKGDKNVTIKQGNADPISMAWHPSLARLR